MQQLSGLGLKDAVTLCSLACGVTALSLSAQGHYSFATVAVLAAVVFDFLDGKVARGTATSNNFGRELDSLSDAVSFGSAPAFAAMAALNFSWPAIALAAVYASCVVIRLARFNLQKNPGFVGLPSPAAALAVMLAVDIAPNPLVFLFIAVTSYLMVSDIRLPKP